MLASLAVLLAAGLAADPVQPTIAANPAQRGPWLEMSAGPSFEHQSGRAGLGSGPLVRMGLGTAVTERFAAELWLSGALQSAPLAAPGDTAVVAGGLGGRVQLHSFDSQGKLVLWARAGLGWGAAAAGVAQAGPSGFAGAALIFQPFVRRFALGVELDALGSRGSLGLALLPTLRCAL